MQRAEREVAERERGGEPGKIDRSWAIGRSWAAQVSELSSQIVVIFTQLVVNHFCDFQPSLFRRLLIDLAKV
jgi:hypothetical protein